MMTRVRRLELAQGEREANLLWLDPHNGGDVRYSTSIHQSNGKADTQSSSSVCRYGLDIRGTPPGTLAHLAVRPAWRLEGPKHDKAQS